MIPDRLPQRDHFVPWHTHSDRWRLLSMLILVLFAVCLPNLVFGDPFFRILIIVYFIPIFISAVFSAYLSRHHHLYSQLIGIVVGYIIFLFFLYYIALNKLWEWGDWAVEIFKSMVPNLQGGRYAVFDVPVFVFEQLLNIVIVIALPLVMSAVATSAHMISGLYRARFDPEPTRLRDRVDLWFVNATFANAAGWIAILLPVLMIISLIWVAVQDPDWTYIFLGDYRWGLFVAPLLYFGFSVQRQPLDAPELESTATEDAARPPPSVRPLYRSLSETPDLAPHVLFRDWPEALAKADLSGRETLRVERRTRDIAHLMEGRTIVRYGTADAEFYRLVSGVVSQAQDRGQACLLICPDKAGSAIRDHLRADEGFEFPDIARRFALWQARPSGEHTDDVATLFDLIIVEETALLRILTQMPPLDRAAYLDPLLHRTAAFVAVDYHALDASRLYMALHEIDNSVFTSRVGMLVQSYEHYRIDSQIQKICGLINPSSGNLQQAEAGPLQVERGLIVLAESPDLRKALLARYGYTNGPTRYTTAPYLVLKSFGAAVASGPVAAAEALTVFILESHAQSRIAEGLRNGLRQRPPLREIHPFRLFQSSHHYAPRGDLRIAIIPDEGNFIDPLAQDFAFWGLDNDYLVIIVSQGYPGRSYLRDKVGQDDDQDERHLRPMAQEPGIGITDIAIRISLLLSRPEGLSERQVEDLMRLPSGKIRDYIDVTPTRRGLAKLFSIIRPGQPQQIETRFDATQSATFRLPHRAPLVDDDNFGVVEEGTRNRLTEVALADEGLLFCEGEEVRLGDRLLRIERVAKLDRILTAARLDAHSPQLPPVPQHYFRRRYRILAREAGTGEGDEPRFVGERGINPSQSYLLTCYCGHIHVAIERTSDGYMSLSSDVEPEPDTISFRSRDLKPAPRHRRPFRSICILAFEDRQGSHQDDILVWETLAAALQVVLGLSFPMIRQRIAVIPIEGPADPHADLKRPYATSYLFPQGSLVGESVSSILSRLHRSGESSRQSPLEDSDLRGPFVSFAVIEDSITDLGVARRVHDDIDEVITRWRLFLDWAAETKSWNAEGLLDAERAADFPGLISKAPS